MRTSVERGLIGGHTGTDISSSKGPPSKPVPITSSRHGMSPVKTVSTSKSSCTFMATAGIMQVRVNVPASSACSITVHTSRNARSSPVKVKLAIGSGIPALVSKSNRRRTNGCARSIPTPTRPGAPTAVTFTSRLLAGAIIGGDTGDGEGGTVCAAA